MSEDQPLADAGPPLRRRSDAWRDPGPARARLGRASGLEQLGAVLAGRLPPPPVAVANRFRLCAVAAGRVVYEGIPGEDHYNDVGGVQGGWVASLLDAALGSAVHSRLAAGYSYTTLDLKVNFVRGVSVASGPLTAIGEALHVGGRTATAQATLTDAAGRLHAHGSTTCLILPLPG